MVRLPMLGCSPAGRLLQGLNEDCQTIQLGIGEKVGSRGMPRPDVGHIEATASWRWHACNPVHRCTFAFC